MEPERVRLILVVGMLLCAGLMLVYPLSSEMSADILFDDDVDDRIEQESIGNSTRYGLVLRIVHDDGGKLTSNLSRLQALMKLEQEALDGSNPETAWDPNVLSLPPCTFPIYVPLTLAAALDIFTLL